MTSSRSCCAGIFPLLHIGRPWFCYWLFPYPNTMDIWPQFRSPLVWDVFAVSTYATVSLLFWYVGLIPDLATLRDRARTSLAKLLYGMLALGWRGSALHWQRYETAYLLLAGLATPLVALGAHRRELRLRRRRRARAGTRRSSRPTSSRAPSTPASRWCSRWRFRIRAYLRAGRLHHDAAHPELAKVMLVHGPHRALRLLGGSIHRVVQRRPVREAS